MRPVALVGWELGGGRGHVEILKPVITALLRQGWHVVAAMRNLDLARSAFGNLEHEGACEFRQAPIFLHRAVPPKRQLFALSEALEHAGFADPGLWSPVVGAWWRLVADVRPDIILADSAPSLVLATRGRIPIVMVGNGWTLPPKADSVPRLAISGYDQYRALSAEKAIADAANKIMPGFSQAAHFTDLLRGNVNFVFSPPSLDPFRRFRDEPCWWPPVIEWKPTSTDSLSRLVAYLPHRHIALTNLAKSLSSYQPSPLAYFGDKNVEDRTVKISEDAPLHLPSVLPLAPCAIHHGGLGITSWCLAFGIPQLIMPHDVEKHLYAQAVFAINRGNFIPSTSDVPTILAAIEDTIDLGRVRRENISPFITIKAVTDACFSFIK